LTILIYRLQRQNKHLDYEIVSATPLILGEATGIEALELRYKGELIENPYLLLFRLINAGNQPIVPDDYQEEICVRLNEPAQVLTAEITGASPGLSNAKVQADGCNAVVSKLLLNPGDWLAIKLLARQAPEQTKVEGRIAGVTAIRPYDVGATEKRFDRFVTMPVLILGMITGFVGIWVESIVIFTVGAIAFFGVLAVSVYLGQRTQKRRRAMQVSA
jgi:hypothetical protein